MSTDIITIVSVFSLIWLSVLSVFVFRMIAHYNSLTHGTTKTGLKEILDGILGEQRHTKEQIKQLIAGVGSLHADGKFHIQRIGLVRFNPFSDTGGSQSFTLALLDGHDNGLVMTSLYARSGNRWYVKEIVGGKGKQLELSKEEGAAISRAKPFEHKS